jgi:Tfp pilus assembly protein PilV
VLRRILRAARPEDGFTMTEVLVSSATMLVVAVAAFGLMLSVARMQPQVSERSGEIQQARSMVERISRELRQGYGVDYATSSQLVLLTYAGGCRTTATAGSAQCQITYTCAAGSCTRQAADPTGTYRGTATRVVSGLASNQVFQPSPGYLGIRVSYPAERGDDAVTLTDGVALRNLPAA